MFQVRSQSRYVGVNKINSLYILNYNGRTRELALKKINKTNLGRGE